jgi:hypothetical protein
MILKIEIPPFVMSDEGGIFLDLFIKSRSLVPRDNKNVSILISETFYNQNSSCLYRYGG